MQDSSLGRLTLPKYNVGEPMEEYAKKRNSERAEEMQYERRIFGFGGKRGFLPLDVTGLEAWFRFNTGIVDAAGAVSQWTDQSGKGRHLLQATGASQPAKQTDGSILFDGTDDFMQCNAFTLNQPMTVYLLARQVTWTSNDYFFDGNTGASVLLFQKNGGASPTISIFAGTIVADNGNLAVGSYGAICAIFNGASSSLQVNNTAETTGNAGAQNAGGFTLSANAAGSSSGNIQCKEVIIYSTAHSATQRSQLIGYLSQVGGLGL